MTFADFSLCMAATNHYNKENCVTVSFNGFSCRSACWRFDNLSTRSHSQDQIASFRQRKARNRLRSSYDLQLGGKKYDAQ